MMEPRYVAEFVTVRLPTGRRVCEACGAWESCAHEGFCAHAGKKANALWRKMVRAVRRGRGTR